MGNALFTARPKWAIGTFCIATQKKGLPKAKKKEKNALQPENRPRKIKTASEVAPNALFTARPKWAIGTFCIATQKIGLPKAKKKNALQPENRPKNQNCLGSSSQY